MLKAIIFDCDGVIADTEPIHKISFARVLAEEGITLVGEDYHEHYLALDDRACFIRAFGEKWISLAQERLRELIRRRVDYSEQGMKAGLRLFPGVADLVRAAADRYPLAIASGALRTEIEHVLRHGGLRDHFQVIVSAEDVLRSKPDPDPFIKALELLVALNGDRIQAQECIVIEDSIRGIRAARQAGMRCLAVSNSYPKDQLLEADLVVDNLSELSLEDVENLLTDVSI